MIHRHLTHQQFTLAAIDDIIGRGKRKDWAELRRAVLADPVMRDKILRVCQSHVPDPYAQRYHFWKHYAVGLEDCSKAPGRLPHGSTILPLRTQRAGMRRAGHLAIPEAFSLL
ncbi:MAG: hypothetical protein KBG20_11880 [Caldilineaceae bacterium]|nr:hypothetical protein [Caldilineaceae bacterium]MBP8122544.1 hypothetical protein [Caldilineaceae bacterium]MBP9072997.1 hypothetical protein [Caldilineaceae bacterium]